MDKKTFFKTIGKCVAFVGLACSVTACGDNTFTVDGTIEGADDCSLVLERGFNGQWIALDSVRTSSVGDFSIDFEAPTAPEIYRLRLDNRFVYFPIDSLEHITVASSVENYGEEFTLSGSDQAVKMMNFEKEAAMLSLEDSAAVNKFKRKVFSEIIKDSQASILSYYVLNKTIDGKYLFNPSDAFDRKIYAAVATAYKQFKPNDPRTALLEEVALVSMRRVNAEQGRQTVIEAPEVSIIDIELKDVNGEVLRLKDVVSQGKKTVVVFSLLTDEKSPEVNRELAKIYETHKGSVNFYQVCLDYDQLAWKQAAVNLPWTVVYDPNGAESQYVAKYNVQALPAVFIYNASGELTSQAASFADLEVKLR